MNGYVLAGTAFVVVGMGVYLVYSNNKQKMRMENTIKTINDQLNDYVITEAEAPGLSRAIRSGDIHTSQYRYYRGRDT